MHRRSRSEVNIPHRKERSYKENQSDADSVLSLSQPTSLSPIPQADLWSCSQCASASERATASAAECSRLSDALRDAREQLELLEFRVLELEDSGNEKCNRENFTDSDSGCVSPGSRIKDSASPELRRVDSGYKSPPHISPCLSRRNQGSRTTSLAESGDSNELREHLEHMLVNCDLPEDRGCLEQVLMLLYAAQGSSDEDVQTKCKKVDHKPGKAVATVNPYTQQHKPVEFTNSADSLFSETPKKGLFGALQESGIFEEVDTEDKETQTDTEQIVRGDLSKEIERLDSIRERLEREGINRTKTSEGLECDCVKLGKKHRQFYERRLKFLEGKISIYEAAPGVKEARLAQRLQNEFLLESRIQELESELSTLQDKYDCIEQDYCELEELENDTRLQAQHLELECEVARAELSDMAAAKECSRALAERLTKEMETREIALRKRETELVHRLSLLENAFPAIILWNVAKAVGFSTNADKLALKSKIEPICSDPNNVVRTLKEHFKNRTEMTSTAVAWETLHSAESEDCNRLIQERAQLEMEAAKQREEFEQKITELERAKNIEVAIAETKLEDYQKQIEDLSKQLETKQEDRTEKLTDNVDSSALKAQLTSMATTELSLKLRVHELEKREKAYLEMLTQADDMWAEMEHGYKGRISEMETEGERLRISLGEVEKEKKAVKQQLMNTLETQSELRVKLEKCERDNEFKEKEIENLTAKSQHVEVILVASRHAFNQLEEKYKSDVELSRQKTSKLATELKAQKEQHSEIERALRGEMDKLRKELNRTCKSNSDLEVTNGELREELAWKILHCEHVIKAQDTIKVVQKQSVCEMHDDVYDNDDTELANSQVEALENQLAITQKSLNQSKKRNEEKIRDLALELSQKTEELEELRSEILANRKKSRETDDGRLYGEFIAPKITDRIFNSFSYIPTEITLNRCSCPTLRNKLVSTLIDDLFDRMKNFDDTDLGKLCIEIPNEENIDSESEASIKNYLLMAISKELVRSIGDADTKIDTQEWQLSSNDPYDSSKGHEGVWRGARRLARGAAVHAASRLAAVRPCLVSRLDAMQEEVLEHSDVKIMEDQFANAIENIVYESSINANTNNEFYCQIYAENGVIFRSKTAQRTGFNDHYKKFKKFVEKRVNANNSTLRDIRDIHKKHKKENDKSPKYIRTQYEHRRNSGLFGVVGKRSYFVGASVDADSKTKANMHEAGQCGNAACSCEDCDPGTCNQNNNLPCNSSGYAYDNDKVTPNIFDIELASEKLIELEDLKFFVKDTGTATNEKPPNEEPPTPQPPKLKPEDVIARIKNAFDNCSCKVCNCLPGEASCRPGCGCKQKGKDNNKPSCAEPRSPGCKPGDKSVTDMKSEDLKTLLEDCEQCNCILCQLFLKVVKTIDSVAIQTRKFQCDCEVCQKLKKAASKHCLCKLRNMPCENCKQSNINTILSKAYQQAVANLTDSLLNDDTRRPKDKKVQEFDAEVMKHHEGYPCSKCNLAKGSDPNRNSPKIKRSQSSTKARVSEQSTSQGLKTACKCKKCLDHTCEKITSRASNKSGDSNKDNDDSASNQCWMITNPMLCTNYPAVYSQRYAKTMQRDSEKHKCRDCYSKKHNSLEYKIKTLKRNNDDFLDEDPSRLHHKSKPSRHSEHFKDSSEVAAVSSTKTYILSNTHSRDIFEQRPKMLRRHRSQKSPSPKQSRAIPDLSLKEEFTEEFCEYSIPKCKTRILDDYLKGVGVDRKNDKHHKIGSSVSGRSDCYSPKSIARNFSPIKTELHEEARHPRNSSNLFAKYRPSSKSETCSSKQIDKRRETIRSKDKKLENILKMNKARTISSKGFQNKDQSQTDNGISVQQKRKSDEIINFRNSYSNRKSKEIINIENSPSNDTSECKIKSETESKCAEQLVSDLFQDMVTHSYDYGFHRRNKDDSRNTKSDGIIRVSPMDTNQEKNIEKFSYGLIKSESLEETNHSNSSQSYKTTCDSELFGETMPIDIESRDVVFESKVVQKKLSHSEERSINLVPGERTIFENKSNELDEQIRKEVKPHDINKQFRCNATCNIKQNNELLYEFSDMDDKIINDPTKLETHTGKEGSIIEFVDMHMPQGNTSKNIDFIDQTDKDVSLLKNTTNSCISELTPDSEKVGDEETYAYRNRISDTVIDDIMREDLNRNDTEDELKLTEHELNENDEVKKDINDETGSFKKIDFTGFFNKQDDGSDTSHGSISTIISRKLPKQELNEIDDSKINSNGETGSLSMFDVTDDIEKDYGSDTSFDSGLTEITDEKFKQNKVDAAAVNNENLLASDSENSHKTVTKNNDSVMKTTESKIIENLVKEFFSLSHIDRLKNDRDLFHKFIETIQKYETLSNGNKNDVTLEKASNDTSSYLTGFKEKGNLSVGSEKKQVSKEEMLEEQNLDCVNKNTCGGKISFGKKDANIEFVQLDFADIDLFNSRSVSPKSIKETIQNISSFGLISEVSSFQSDETVTEGSTLSIASSEVAVILNDILNRTEYRDEAMRLMEVSLDDQDELDECLINNGSRHLLSASNDSAYLVARANELSEDILDDSNF